MKTSIYPLLAGIIAVALLLYGNLPTTTATDTPAEDGIKREVLRHIVLFRFKEETTSEQIDAVMAQLRALQDHIEEVKAFEWGIENSGRNLNDGYTHGAIFTYDNKEDLETYLVHPVHVEAADFVREYVESTFIFDYWAQD